MRVRDSLDTSLTRVLEKGGRDIWGGGKLGRTGKLNPDGTLKIKVINMEFHKPITILELINTIRSKKDKGESYCIYGNGDSSTADLSTVCYMDAYGEITDDYEEIYSQFVRENDLNLWFREELVQDVISNAFYQNKNVTDEKILEAIKYYDENDSFLDL